MDIKSDSHEKSFRRWKTVQTKFSRALNDFQTASADFCNALSASAAYPFPRISLERILSAIDSELISLQADEDRLKKAHAALAKERNNLKLINPVHRLPSEILATIFSISTVQYVRPDRSSLSKPEYVSPTILSGVCSLWRRVALETHSLWSKIDIVAGGKWNRQFNEAILWSKRSHNMPLHIALKDYPDSRSLSLSGVYPSEVMGLIKFLSPLMPRVRVLDIWLLSGSYKMFSDVVECWIKHAIHMPEKILQLRLDLRELEPPLVLSPGRFGSVSSEAFNAFFRTISTVCLLNCCIPVPAMFSEALLELHLEDLYEPYSLSQQDLADMLAASPRLRILALANCCIEPSDATPAPVALDCLQSLSLEFSSHSPSGLEYVLPLLAIGSESLDMSLTLHDDPEFIAEVESFFGRTRVTRLYVRDFSRSLSLGLLLFPMTYLQTLAVEACAMSGPTFRKSLNPNGEAHSGVSWPQLETLYLINPLVDMNSLRFLKNLVRLHSFASIHVYGPMVPETREPIIEKECNKLERKLARIAEDLEIYPDYGYDSPINDWDFIIRA
ncbi:hypothetical protein FRC09_020655 [Ceratobasidium sp. 395]|nr:hypothetical protein FRC09_020655 [Ceratobasidium sp. 395]